MNKNISYIKNIKDLLESDLTILKYQNEIKNGGIIIIRNLIEKKKN